MMEQGYSGAREMDRLVENLWGWETTVPDLVTESTWNEVHEIYVRDRYDLGLREFFDQSNPWAEQSLTGRMLEASRKDRWHPDEAAKAELAQEYDRSVQDYGAASDNHLLQEYVQDAFTVSENQDRSKSRQNISSYSKSAPSRSHSSGDSSDRFNTTQSGGVGTSSSKPAEPKDEAVVSEKREVQGMS
jgi:cobaltochelatase CobN